MSRSAKSPPDGRKVVTSNRRARHDYEIVETVEAGLVLEGSEVKSLRAGNANLKDGYATFTRGEAWLENAYIAPYKFARDGGHDPERRRKLLLHRREIDRLAGAVDRQGYALIPVRMFWSRGKAKLAVGLARGKKQHDKRATEREREWQRDKERALKQA